MPVETSDIHEAVQVMPELGDDAKEMADRLHLWSAIRMAGTLIHQCFAPVGSIRFERLVDPEAPDDEILYGCVGVRMSPRDAVRCEMDFSRLFRKGVPLDQRRFITVAAVTGE